MTMYLNRFTSMKLLILLLLVSSCSLSEADIENDLEANIIGDFEEEGNAPEDPDRRECDFEKDASDLYIRTPDLIRKNGFPSEVHHVTSEDGYILEMHRIPGDPGSPPVILHHGMLMTSRSWFLNCDGRALPFKLSANGNDVWIVNVRGNMYSMGHVNLTVNDRKYWSYTVDDLIKYDAPATIDYVLNVTGAEKTNWVGWSLGTAVLMGLTSSRPEYNDKINVFFSMGTVAYVGQTRSPVFRLWGLVNKLYDRALTTLTRGAFIPSVFFPILHSTMPTMCLPEARYKFIGVCSSMLFLLDGFSPYQLNHAFLPFAFANYPNTGSVKMVMHWFQWIASGRFAMYDYGMRGNLQRYGQPKPPEYDLSKVTAKVVNFWSDNDWISTPQDVQRTVRSLRNVQNNIHVNRTEWNHFDYALGKDADLYIYNNVVKIIDQFK